MLMFISYHHCHVSWLLHSIQGKWKPKLISKLWFILLAVPANYNKWQRLLIETFIVLKHYRDAKRIKLKAGCSGVQSFSPSSCWWWRWSSCSGPPMLHYTVPLAGLEVPLYSFTGWSWSPPSYVKQTSWILVSHGYSLKWLQSENSFQIL